MSSTTTTGTTSPTTTAHHGKRSLLAASTSTSRTDKNGAPLSEKKLRRLEKNRLSARECRRRKREATEHMQRQINLLEGENLRLRLQLQVGEEAEVNNQEEQQKLTEVLDDLLKSGASEAEIYTKIEEYKEKFADYGRDRRSAIEFHLRNIERLLMPTQTTSVVLATLQMGNSSATTPMSGKTPTSVASSSIESIEDTVSSPSPPQDSLTPPEAPLSESSFTNHPATSSNSADKSLDSSCNPGKLWAPPTNLDAKSLFQHLVEILQVTPEQGAALKDSRFVAKEMDECLKASLGVLQELRLRLAQCGDDLENEFNNVRSILTPTQAAKFLVWVANNKACMHMLNELWSRVYPQQHHPPPSILTSMSSEDDMIPSP